MPLIAFDNNFAMAADTLLIGVDEAGRGPLAGPVVACACHIPAALHKHPLMAQINDSKKLSHKKRALVANGLKRLPITYCLGFASAREIDQINILQATFLAMRRALAKFKNQNIFVLVDGNKLIPQMPHSQRAVIGGDAKSLNIAAASILAKVARDDFMLHIHAQHPQYGFDGHKGYGAASHIEAIRKNGPCPQHRLSFEPLKSLYGGLFNEEH